jgi:hypothetical protein
MVFLFTDDIIVFMVNIFKQKPFPFSFLILGFLIILHSAGSYYSWYWQYSWFDFVVHAVSGLWAAMLILWLASVFGQINSLKEYKIKTFLIAFISAILIGIVWELVENYTQITFTQASGYGLDTTLDIISDSIGGILAYFYFIRRRRCEDKSCEILHPFYNQTGLIKVN